MDFKDFSDKVFQKSMTKFDEAELYRIDSETKKIGIFNGELDKYGFSNTSGISLRGIRAGSPGYSYTEAIDDKSIDILIEGALGSAEDVESDSVLSLTEGGLIYPSLPDNNGKFSDLTTDDKIEIMLKLEKSTISRDERIKTVQECLYQEFGSSRSILNNKGVDLNYQSKGGFAYISVVAKQENDTKTGASFRIFRDPGSLDIEDMADEAASEALSMLGASPVDSGMYPVVLRFNVFAEILEAFFPVFAADNVQKGLSGLKGKLETVIATKNITIWDDPFHEDGFSGTPFDDEGIPTFKKLIIEKGVLKTFLYNLRSASKEGKESTGNGFRTSYKAAVGISPTNVYLEPGDSSLEDLLKKADDGIFITSVAGLHSGLDTVSGDFSVQAMGYRIKNGVKGKPVNGITISGNFFKVLESIESIGSDLRFTLPGNGHFGSPSILVRGASISGN